MGVFAGRLFSLFPANRNEHAKQELAKSNQPSDVKPAKCMDTMPD